MPSAPSGTSVRRSWSIAYDGPAWTGMAEHSERLMFLVYLLFDLSTQHHPGLNSKSIFKCIHLLCMNTVQSPSWLKCSPIPKLKQHCAHIPRSPLSPAPHSPPGLVHIPRAFIQNSPWHFFAKSHLLDPARPKGDSWRGSRVRRWSEQMSKGWV